MAGHRVVGHDEWLQARVELLAREKELTRLRDDLNRRRRELPWERVEKSYSFEGPRGRESLAELFGKRSQLVVYHFMFAPDWKEGCPHCSFWADSFDRVGAHLGQRDTSFVAISRAPLEKLLAFQRRMGWTFRWLSSQGSDFNYDYQASFREDELAKGEVFYNYRRTPMDMSEREGVSAFYRETDGSIFHTYSAYARGIDLMNAAYNVLDLTAKGRDEDGLDGPQAWVRHRDRYQD